MQRVYLRDLFTANAVCALLLVKEVLRNKYSDLTYTFRVGIMIDYCGICIYC